LTELLLNYGSDPNGKSAEGVTPLFEAIQARRLDILTLLLDHGANPNLPGPKHPLWPSTYQAKILQLMLSRGADTKKAPGCLELATSLNNVESVRILLNAGVDPNMRKDGIYTPLCSAIRDNRPELITLLLSKGADPNHMASEYPAWKCVTHDRAQYMPQLVAAGADLHKPKGILEKAVAHNNKDALNYLLAQKVNPNDRSPEGHTALTTAIREDRAEMLDLLLAHGADPTIRGQDWPICMAVKRPAILKKLLPALHNPRSVKGVMEMAVVANQLESIKLLLQAGISVEDKNGGVFSPLTTAIREDRKEIVRFLLDEAGADINAPGEHLPIVKAIRRYRGGDLDIMEMLLDRGVDINKMYRGWNSVLQAVESGNARILHLLNEKGGGINLQVVDEDSGKTAQEIMIDAGWEEAYSSLLEN
jgi:ankyrin repeat protein